MKRIFIVVLLAGLVVAVAARESVGGVVDWSGWLLPTDYARHGVAIDRLFNWIAWITMFVFVAVQVALIGVIIRYRHGRSQHEARFIRGNIRLEIIWTLIPTMILGGLALGSAKVWDDYRYSADDPNVANILVIGQQFKWNIIYPGKDGKFGRYLIYPKPTDFAWPHQPADKKHLFAGVPGPASLPYKQAIAAIDQFISQNGPEYQLGKDFSDPDGADDDYQEALGRTLFLPVDRPVHIEVLSRDVIHDFYLPNFRVQLYAVPGMTGSFTFTPSESTAEIEAPSRRQYTVDELAKVTSEAEYRRVSDDHILSSEVLARLNADGVTAVSAYRPAHLEAICAQLCGIGHATMKTDIVVLSQEEYHRRFE